MTIIESLLIGKNFNRFSRSLSLLCSLVVTYWIIIFYSESNGIFCNVVWALLNFRSLKTTSLALLVRNNFFCSLFIRLYCIFIILNVPKQTIFLTPLNAIFLLIWSVSQNRQNCRHLMRYILLPIASNANLIKIWQGQTILQNMM